MLTVGLEYDCGLSVKLVNDPRPFLDVFWTPTCTKDAQQILWDAFED
jgi:hypothetical protein